MLHLSLRGSPDGYPASPYKWSGPNGQLCPRLSILLALLYAWPPAPDPLREILKPAHPPCPGLPGMAGAVVSALSDGRFRSDPAGTASAKRRILSGSGAPVRLFSFQPASKEYFLVERRTEQHPGTVKSAQMEAITLKQPARNRQFRTAFQGPGLSVQWGSTGMKQ